MMETLLARLDEADLEQAHALFEGDGEAQSRLLGMLWPHYFSSPAAAVPYPGIAVNPGDTTMASASEHFTSGTLEQHLPTLRCPVLFIHGRHDPIPLASCEATAALIPHASLTVMETGHFPWLEAPDLVSEHLTGFASGALLETAG